MTRDLAPGLLVATPTLRDSMFAESVVLMIAHSDEGALGLVLNSQKVLATLGELLEQLGFTDEPRKFQDPVRSGGPVQPEIGWIVYEPLHDTTLDGEVKISSGVAVSQSRDVLAAIGKHEGPKLYFTCLGYAGWAPGQLEDEIRAGAWLPTDLHEEIVFSVDIEKRWKAAFTRSGIASWSLLANRRGSA